MCVYDLGKEEIFIELAKYFKTKIIVSESRYNAISLCEIDMNYFTTNENEGFLEVSRRGEVDKKLN